MNNPIKTGCMYRRSPYELKKIAENAHLSQYAWIGVSDEFDHLIPKEYLKASDLIVVLEVFYHTAAGKKLRGDTNFRAKILAPSGRICYLYSSFETWEEVC